MKTSRPFSTISYNTRDFLRSKLEELYSRNILSFYAFIHHEPEEDEKKDHIHLFLVPNGTQNTDTIRDYFKEYDPTNPLKPRGCLPCNSSKFGDWYLYSLHNPDYLAAKGQAREFIYTESEMEVSDDLYFGELKGQVDFSPLRRLAAVRSAAENGTPFSDLVRSGFIPVPLINQYEKTYNICVSSYVFRNGRRGHEEDDSLPPLPPKK